MKKCYHCKKFIWPWQNKYFGVPTAHAICDSYAFWRDAVEVLGPDLSIEQVAKRNKIAYERPLV